MTEAKLSSEVLRRVRHLLPEGVCFKHSDNYTAGMPDFSISIHGATAWFESKLSSNRRWYEPIQLELLKRLHGYYLIYDTKTKIGQIFPSSDVIEVVKVGLPLDVEFALGLDDLAIKVCDIALHRHERYWYKKDKA